MSDSERTSRLIHLSRVIHPFPIFMHSHIRARAHARTHGRTHATGGHAHRDATLGRRHASSASSSSSSSYGSSPSPLPPFLLLSLALPAFPSSSHSNRIVSIINEAALGFSGASLPSYGLPCRCASARVPDTRLRPGRSLFIHARE